MEQFGDYLKAQREKKGIRLEEIASITKIHLHSLELLEASKWASLPPEPFLRGFIIAYAKYIGLDPKECLGKYLEVMHPKTVAAPGAPSSEPQHSSPAEARVNQPPAENPGALIESSGVTPSRQIIVATAALFLLVVVGSLIYVGKRALRHNTTQEVTDTATSSGAPERQTTAAVTVAPAPRAVSGAPAPSPTPATSAVAQSKAPAKAAATPEVKAAASPTPNPADASKHRLAVEVQHKSWAKVVIDDKAPKEMILDEGEKMTFEANTKIKLVLGNAAGSTVLHNGEPVTGTKYDGTIRYWKFPKGARFAQDKKSARKSHESADDDDSSSDE